MNFCKNVKFCLVILLLFFCMALPSSGEQNTTTITDLAGKEITLKTPVEHIVLQDSGSGGAFFTLFALEGKDAVKKIAAIDEGLDANRNDIWQKFTEAVPDLMNIPEIKSGKDLNIESLVTLKPDVLIVPKITYDAAVDTYKKVEEAGIPVVVIDYHAETLDSHEKSMKIIGKLLGKEKEAGDLFAEYKTQMNTVTSRLSGITSEKPRVYVECASKSPDDLTNSYGKVMWGGLIEQCNGDNIAEGVVDSAPLNKEYIFDKNPEVIIYTGAYWPKEPRSLRMGFSATNETARSSLAPYINREGWSSLDAVKNNRVYAVYHGLSRDIMDFAAFQFVAKAIYPEEFADLQPEENLKQFYKKYMPVDLSGTWMIEPDLQKR